jgi:uncharacterized protein (TIGR02596 family)
MRRCYPIRQVDAFTLLELLCVMAVAVILLALAIQGAGGFRQAQALTAAGALVASSMEIARQTAITENAPVRWQLIRVSDARNGDPAAYRLVRLQKLMTKQRAWVSIGRQEMFPVAVIADPDQSSLLSESAISEISDLRIGGQSGQTAKAATVIFHPSGRTSLNLNAKHSITLRSRFLTGNFVTVEIDPVSARTQSFRP